MKNSINFDKPDPALVRFLVNSLNRGMLVDISFAAILKAHGLIEFQDSTGIFNPTDAGRIAAAALDPDCLVQFDWIWQQIAEQEKG